ncbi:hypothetical protein DFH07DRAFT_461114 [Mycena maculata]|uniref:Uncharacterized protein n=1 Tax=Mycena maculata TaxID=230809 RepID=A0AAD7J4Z9_9AGAR|nr:hypothetical protein DFH07DRAFT_461114 [Mycena maculata]
MGTFWRSDHCQDCGKSADIPVDWDLRVRYCSECELTNTTKFDSDAPPRLVCDPSVDIRKLIAIRPPTFNPAFVNADLIAVTDAYEAMNAQERPAYQDGRHRMLIDTRIHARECREWAARLAQFKRAAVKAGRKQAIEDKLIALGWSEDSAKLYIADYGRRSRFSYREFVDKCEPLTDAEWAEIQPDLQELMATTRADAASQAAKAVLLADRTQAI